MHRLLALVLALLLVVPAPVATTLVATPAGPVPIGTIEVGDLVTSYDETTGTQGSYPVSAVHRNADPLTGTVVIASESIGTTPEHPFYTLERGWTDARDLQVGWHVPSATGEPGRVESVDFSGPPAVMLNLTVEVAHTFHVGTGAWLVHNTDCGGRASSVWDARVSRWREEASGRFTKAPTKVPSGTEVVERAMSLAELSATRSTGLIRGGRSGTHYVSNAVNSRAQRARLRLALPRTPEVRVRLEVPRGRFTRPTTVRRTFAGSGGGTERWGWGDIPVRVLGYRRYD